MSGGAPAGGPGAPRIFQIGFSRCGTTSIAAFLNRSGIPCVHHDGGRLARRMRANLAAGRRPLEGYEHYRAFADMAFRSPTDHFDGFVHFEALLAAYGGRFILNTRPVEHWLASMLRRQARRRWRAAQARRYGTAEPGRVAERLRAEWEAHHRRVREAVPPGRLLVFDIESDPPERLCDFVGVPRARAALYTHENPAFNALGALLEQWLPRPVKRAVPERVKQPAKRLLRRRDRE